MTAPIDGVVLPPSYTPKREDPELQLGAWSGTPLEPENVGAYLEERALFCQIGDPKKLRGRDGHRPGRSEHGRSRPEGGSQNRRASLEDLSDSEITDIAESELKEAPKRLASKYGGEVPTKTDPLTGIEQPQSTSYQADVPIDDDDGLLRLGLRGTARIYTRWLSGGERFWRFLSHTFNFKL